jgi:hypothetical protein
MVSGLSLIYLKLQCLIWYQLVALIAEFCLSSPDARASVM